MREDDLDAQFALCTPHWNTVREGDPAESLALIAQLARDAPSHGHLCALGVALIEVLLDCYPEIGQAFLEEMAVKPNLRKASSCAELEDYGLWEAIAAARGDGEDIGRESS